MSLSEMLRPVTYDHLPGWTADEGISEAFAAFSRSACQAATRPYRTGGLGIAFESFAAAYAQARSGKPSVRPGEAREFFEQHFLPFQVRPDAGGRGLVTGYYEPEAEASRVRSERFLVPLYRRPDDLVDVDDENRPQGLDPYFAFARRSGDSLEPYWDREAIDRGALQGRGLELCWLADRVDTFFIHVQGAARLRFLEGGQIRVTYAAKSGHRFTGIGRVLADLGEIPLEKVSMQTIRAWLNRNPQRQDEILWRNRSYIFFRETQLGDPALGPVAAAKVQLQPARSIAVDRTLHTFGTPFFVHAPELRHVDGAPFRRLMIAQDTGSAITGTARGDLFIGTGVAAGEIAGTIRHPADFYVLLPKSLVAGA
ncbi:MULTISPECIES: murein transglycosylase A [Chelativorans]|jgi:membrane-bound lytic murein transglycosylase A|uniref:peptidoglycan lytic exotransglycosylase n=1 Tax=Chelativorans sp. (strain BNC1) TaxID=266779 RepID=Q11CL8_CHESB|nr:MULTISPECIES: murein transglycosylase A [Chelativorans]